MLALESRDRVIVVGKTGTGKGKWTKTQLVAWMAAFAVVFFDVMDEYSVHGLETKECKLGPLTERCTVSELLDDPARYLTKEKLALAVVPDSRKPTDVAADFADVMVQVRHEAIRRGGGMVLGSDELGHFAKYSQDALLEVGTQFRHWGVATVLIAQRAVFIPLPVRSQASHIISFRQDEDEDLEQLYRRTRRSDEKFAERVSRLRLGQFEHWRDTTTEAA